MPLHLTHTIQWMQLFCAIQQYSRPALFSGSYSSQVDPSCIMQLSELKIDLSNFGHGMQCRAELEQSSGTSCGLLWFKIILH